MRVFYDGVSSTGSQVRTRIERDPATGAMLIKRHQPMQAILDFNRNLQAAIDPHAARARRIRGNSGLRQVASIPILVWLRLQKLGITKDKKAFRAWLNGRDQRAFRVDNAQRL